MDLQFAPQYFATARERYQIKLNKDAGLSRTEWTKDIIFHDWRFCNVHREDDKTTVWFREQVRDPLARRGASKLAQVQATVAFRWFNRIETGQRIVELFGPMWNSDEVQRRLKDVAPVVTGAYIIKGKDGMSKLDGILSCITDAFAVLPAMVDRWMAMEANSDITLRTAWQDLTSINYLGPFMAYELVSDLRWSVLKNANDINTWANAGPGCTRGLGRVVSGNLAHFSYGSSTSQAQMLEVMYQLLELSRQPEYWPAGWQPWEMREVEHWSCEFDKYMRVVGGERMKRRYP